MGKQRDTLELLPDGELLRRTEEGLVFRYDRSGRLQEQRDRNGVGFEVEYGEEAILFRGSYGRSVRLTLSRGPRGRRVQRARAPDGSTWRYSYDGGGELESTETPEGAIYRYRYEARDDRISALSAVEKPENVMVRFDYDSAGRVCRVTDEEGRGQEFGYLEGKTTMVDRRGGVTVFQFDERGLPLRRRDPGGGIWTWEYDEEGRILRRTGPEREEERWSYNAAGKPVEHRLPSGEKVRYSYDGAGRVVAVEGGPRGAARYRYDRRGNLVEFGGPWGRWSFSRDSRGRPTEMRDALGNRWRFTYGATGEITELGQPDGTTRGFQYDLLGRLIAVSDETGGTVRFGYNFRGDLTERVDRNGAREEFRYNRRGNLIRRVAPNGEATSFAYDGTQRAVRVTLPDERRIDRKYDGEGALLQVSVEGRAVVRLTRDRSGRVVSREYPIHHVSEELTLDQLGRTVKRRGAEGSRTELTYYPGGALRSRRDHAGAVTLFRRDPSGREVSRTDPGGARWRKEYDSAGRIVRSLSPLGGERRFRYDAMGRLSSWTDELGGVHRYERDWRGNPVSYRSPGGNLWRYEYDMRGLLAKEVSPEGREKRYKRDPEGRIVEILDGSGANRQLEYDALGRLIAVSRGDATWRFDYDASGRLLRITDPDGVYRTYGYDEFDRLRRVSEAGSVVRRRTIAGAKERWEGTRSYTLTRDRRGLVIGYSDPDGVAYSYQYDHLGRLTAIETPEGPYISVERDLCGRPVRLVHRDGSEERRRYDEEGRVTQLHHTDGPAKAFRYDRAGRLVGIRVGAGEWVTRSYDPEGNLIAESSPHGPERAGRRFSYDEDGLLLRASSASGTLEYERDAAGRVTRTSYPEEGVVIERFYGGEGSLSKLRIPLLGLSIERERSPAGRPRSVALNGTTLLTLRHDEAGREETRTVPKVGTLLRSYDTLGRPVAVVFQNPGRVIGEAVVYEYTGAGRLAGELISDGSGKLYSYDRTGSLHRTIYLLGREERAELQPTSANHPAYLPLRKRLEKAAPRLPRALIRHRAWQEATVGRAGYSYPAKEDEQGRWGFFFDALGQLRRIETEGASLAFREDPLGRLHSTYLLRDESQASRSSSGSPDHLRRERTHFYGAPNDLYPILTLETTERDCTYGEVSNHRHRPAATLQSGIPEEGASSPHSEPTLAGTSAEGWNLLLPGARYPSIYLRFSPEGSFGEHAAETRHLSLVARDLRGTPLWRFGESGETGEWLYSATGWCIRGSVEDEAALGFAAGTNAGPLLRLGYRFYEPRSGHFTMADPSGRDLHPTRYAAGDPVNFVDPWGLERYSMMGFDRQNERLLVQVWDDRRPNRPIRVINYGATNRVLSPAERKHEPVRYDPNSNVEGDEYHYFPEEFPDSPREGWVVHSPYQSENAQIGPALRTNASRIVRTYGESGRDGEPWSVTGSVRDRGYYIHGGVGSTTWGCIKMADQDVLELQDVANDVIEHGGESRLYTIGGRKSR
ncbi:MAG: RHS repeat-associated core domain-containing protein [Spirochaetaceae bacterium]